MFKNQFVNFNNTLYIIKKLLKEHLRADTVLKKDGMLYFLETVPDLEIEETII